MQENLYKFNFRESNIESDKENNIESNRETNKK